MKKVTNFIELCKLINEGKAPDKIRIYGLRCDQTLEWDGFDYIASDESTLFEEFHLAGLMEINIEYDEPILTKEERDYLSAVITPWKKTVSHISKEHSMLDPGVEYIAIGQHSKDPIILPSFPLGRYYQRMEQKKQYSLEELGL